MQSVSPETLATTLVVFAGFVAAGLTAHILVSVRNNPDSGDPDLSYPFAAMTGVFSVCVLAFPFYRTAMPSSGGSPVTLGITTLMLVPWTVFALRYAGRGYLLNPRRIVVGVVVSVGFVGLLSSDLFLAPQLPIVLTLFIGLLVIIVVGVLFGTCGVVLISALQHDRVALRHALSLTLPLFVFIFSGQLFNADLAPRVVTTAGIFSVSTGSLVFAVVRYEALDTRPGTSRLGVRAVVDDMDEAMVVLNADERIVRTNGAADRLLGDIVDDRVVDVLDSDVTELRDQDVANHWTSAGHRLFDPRVSAVTSGTGQQIGHAVTLIDITDNAVRRQRIQVLNRILRHNIRNELSAIEARADLATDEGRSTEEELAKIKDVAGDLEQLSTNARQIEKLIRRSRNRDGRPWQLDELVASVVDDVTAPVADGTVSVSVPSVSVSLDKELARYAFRNLVENAVEHNDSPEPRIVVRGERTGLGLRITVADNGPGIPESERNALESGAEDALTHASSLGLWGTSWAVQTLGGSVTIGESELGGAAVTIDLPGGADEASS